MHQTSQIAGERHRIVHLHKKSARERHKITRERLSWYKVQISFNQIAGSQAAQAKTFWSYGSGLLSNHYKYNLSMFF